MTRSTVERSGIPAGGLLWPALAAALLLCPEPARGAGGPLEVTFDKHPDGPYTQGRVRADWKAVRWSAIHDRGRIVPTPRSASSRALPAGKCLEVKYPAGSVGPGQGGGQFHVNLPARDEYWLAYSLMFKEGFDFRLGGKLPGLTGGKSNTGGNKPTGDGWSARYMWKRRGGMILYLYNLDQKGIYGDGLHCDHRFETGRWYRLVQRIRVNTPDQKDGVAQVWVDGKLVLDRNDIRYRNVEHAQVDHFYFSTFHGGNSRDWAPEVDSYTYFDNFIIDATPERMFARPKAKRKKKESKPIVLPDGTEIVIVGGVAFRRRPKGAGKDKGEAAEKPPAVDEARRRPRVPRPRPVAKATEESEKPKEPAEPKRLLKEAETLFIDGDLDEAGELFKIIVKEHPDTPSAAKAREYLDMLE